MYGIDLKHVVGNDLGNHEHIVRQPERQIDPFVGRCVIPYEDIDENAVAQFLDLRGGWAAREYIQGMRNYSGMKTMQIIQKIRETDAKSKGLDNPNTPVGDLLKELVFFILH